MPNVVERTTFVTLRNVSAARLAREFTDPPWAEVSDADLDPLIGPLPNNTGNPLVPIRYWIFDPPASTSLREMNAGEKAAVDGNATLLGDAKTKRESELRAETIGFIQGRYTAAERDEFNSVEASAVGPRLVLLNTFFAWYTSVLAAEHTADVSVRGGISVPAVEAVGIDFAALAATDPQLTIFDVMAA